MIELNRKILVPVLALALLMLILPMSSVSAIKPVTMTLTGTFYVFDNPDGMKYMETGESGNLIIQFRDFSVEWTGDISGSGLLQENMLIKEGPYCDVGVGTHVLKDATIAGVGVGDLTIGLNKDSLQYFIKSGTGDLSSIRGKGAITPVSMSEYDYVFEVQINP